MEAGKAAAFAVEKEIAIDLLIQNLHLVPRLGIHMALKTR